MRCSVRCIQANANSTHLVTAAVMLMQFCFLARRQSAPVNMNVCSILLVLLLQDGYSLPQHHCNGGCWRAGPACRSVPPGLGWGRHLPPVLYLGQVCCSFLAIHSFTSHVAMFAAVCVQNVNVEATTLLVQQAPVCQFWLGRHTAIVCYATQPVLCCSCLTLTVCHTAARHAATLSLLATRHWRA